MLYLLSAPDLGRLDEALPLSGDNDKDLLLFSDAVYLSQGPGMTKLRDLGFDNVYAEKKAVEDRELEAAEGCEVVDMDEVVDLVLDHQKIVNI